MLQSRTLAKDFLTCDEFDAVGLVQGKLIEMIVATDLAEKSADVDVVEIKGVCPQHFTMIALLGDTASVSEALKIISSQFIERGEG
ncbi:MAG: BMC domain-containing protein [Acetobacterium sp.]|nr:BMC domain-containing protein [Acetobacterium sp.]MDO9491483.1 BMC domain-containing protein [Acetobacterium sp.]